MPEIAATALEGNFRVRGRVLDVIIGNPLNPRPAACVNVKMFVLFVEENLADYAVTRCAVDELGGFIRWKGRTRVNGCWGG